MAGQQQPNQSDNSAGMLWGIAAVFAMLAGVWYVFKDAIVSLFLRLKWFEADLLTMISPTHFEPIKNNIATYLVNPAQVSFNQLISVGNSVGDWLRFPFVVILVVLAVIIYFGNATRVFRNIYSMKMLAQAEKNNWPQITPVVNKDLIKTNIDQGPWAMAMTPMQFCKRHRLLTELKAQRREGMLRKEWDRIEVALKRGEAAETFALQLGPLWHSLDKLPIHTKALFAAFAARINSDSKSAAELLARLSASSSSGRKLDTSGMEELLRKHASTKLVTDITNTHAYVSTVMASMLQGAREDGVQASADFLWLKPVDRRLWYMLNTVGRQTPFVEVAGIFAHWVSEKEAGRRLLVPMIDEATRGLEVALKEVIYRRDE